MSFKEIPDNINGVGITFAGDVDRTVDSGMFDALHKLIYPYVSPEFHLDFLHISCATDFKGHKPPSRHTQYKAVDISRINGKHMSVYLYRKGKSDDPEVASITLALQERWEKISNHRENFGPFVKKKCGKPREDIKGHRDHIHASTN